MRLRDLAWFVLIGLLLAGLALTFTGAITGCAGTRAIARVLTPPAAPPDAAPLAVGASLADQLKAEQDKRDAADIRIKSLEKRIVEQDDEHTRKTLLWISLLCLLGFGGAVVAAVWLPVGKAGAVAFAVAFVGIGVLALVARELIPYLPWILPFLVAALGIALIANARKILTALKSSVRFGVDMTAAETISDAEVLKVRHATEQVRDGVHDLISRTIADVKATT